MSRYCLRGYRKLLPEIFFSVTIEGMRVFCFCTLLLACRTTTALEPKASPLESTPDETQLLDAAPLWSPDQRRVSAIHNYLVGEYTLLKGDVHVSHAAFERAYGLDPDPFLGGKAIFTLAELGHTTEALTKSKKMTLLHPRDAYLRFLHGQILARSGQLQAAQQQLQHALVLDAVHLPSHHALIDLHLAQQQWQAARIAAQRLVQAIPSAVHGWSKLSRIYLLLEQKAEALQAARTAFEMQSANPALMLVYAYALTLNDFTAEAMAIYTRLYHSNVTNERFMRHLAGLDRQLGGLPQALAVLDTLATSTMSHSVGVDVQRVAILWELQQDERAHTILQQLLQQHPQASRIVYLTALSEERLSNDTQAIAYYRQLVEDKELGRAARFRLALIYERRNELSQAQLELHQLIDTGKTRWEFYIFLADVYNKQKNYRGALRIATQGLARHPDTVPLLFAKGVYQEKTRDVEGCMQTMRRVLELDPRHSNAHNYLGYLLAEQNTQLHEALRLILRALELKPNNGYYLDSLAWVYYRLGEYHKAHASILQALRLHPDEAVILEHYAEILLKLGRRAEGLRIYQKALQHADEDTVRERLETRIEQLGENS